MSATLVVALCATVLSFLPAPDVSANVSKGLKWLAKQQKPDGSWALSNGNAPTRVTAVAGLALLMEGSTLKEGAYAPHLRKAVQWFEKKAALVEELGRDQDSGATVTRDHAHALLFLVSVADVDEDVDRRGRVKKIVDRALADVVRYQTARGGWSVYLGDPSDTSECTADVLHALFAARRVGFDVPRKVVNAGLGYLVRATNNNGGVAAALSGTTVQYGDDGRGGHRISAYNAAAVALMSDVERPAALARWVKYTGSDGLKQAPDAGRTTYGVLQQFQAARACFLLGESGHRRLAPDVPGKELVTWSAYRAAVYKGLTDAQAQDGTWTDRSTGPAYPTAMALVVLQLDNGYLPAFSR